MPPKKSQPKTLPTWLIPASGIFLWLVSKGVEGWFKYATGVLSIILGLMFLYQVLTDLGIKIPFFTKEDQ